MKFSDYVAEFVRKQGIRHAFAITGGASLHLIDSISRTDGIDYVCPQHEQAGAMAADAYARATGGLGCAIATSGPGATNLITGVICSWFDSVPVLYLTGQVTTFRLKGDSGVRQIGFQETEIVEICRPITKYAVLVNDWRRIRYELEKAVYIARSGRPGPVLVDIPDDFQRMDIDVSQLEAFVPDPINEPKPSSQDIDRVAALLKAAQRPVLILGWGIRLGGAESEIIRLVETLDIPILLTWPVLDLLPGDHPLLVGAFGTHGTRFSNYTLQNSDLLLVIGARLDTREAGSPYKDFARGAKKIVVDIDLSELRKLPKFGMKVDILINADARVFSSELVNRIGNLKRPDIRSWKTQISKWKLKYPICMPEYREEELVNPYVFVETLSAVMKPGDILTLDTGCALAWTCQAFQFKKGQRLFHCFNTTAMGYGLPAAIGISFALDNVPITCITGDGSLQMNLQELATVVRHQLPIRILLINNHGYSMVQQTQDQWLSSRYAGSTIDGGLAFPDFVKVAEAYGIPTVTITKNSEIDMCLREVYAVEGPVFVNVEISADHRVIPQVRFNRPIEDGEPLLPRSEFLENMIVLPTEASLKEASNDEFSAMGESAKALLRAKNIRERKA